MQARRNKTELTDQPKTLAVDVGSDGQSSTTVDGVDDLLQPQRCRPDQQLGLDCRRLVPFVDHHLETKGLFVVFAHQVRVHQLLDVVEISRRAEQTENVDLFARCDLDSRYDGE